MSEARKSRILQAVATFEAGFAAVPAASAANGSDVVSGEAAPSVPAGAEDSNPPPAAAELRRLLSEAAERIHVQATSVGMLWGDERRAPKEDEVDALMSTYEQAVLHFCAICHRVNTGAGSSLERAVTDLASTLVDSCVTLLRALTEGGKHTQLASLTGVVWQACGNVKKAPVDNKTAMSRALTQIAKAAKDALREVSELLEGPTKTPDGQPGEETTGLEDCSDDDDLDFDADELSPAEHVVAECASGAITAVIDGFKSILKVWLSGEFPESDPEDIASLEKALQSARQCGIASENLTASLYSPQDRDEVMKWADCVANAWESLVTTLQPFPRYQEGVGQAWAALSENLSALLVACSELGEAPP